MSTQRPLTAWLNALLDIRQKFAALSDADLHVLRIDVPLPEDSKAPDDIRALLRQKGIRPAARTRTSARPSTGSRGDPLRFRRQRTGVERGPSFGSGPACTDSNRRVDKLRFLCSTDWSFTATAPNTGQSSPSGRARADGFCSKTLLGIATSHIETPKAV